MCTAYHANSAPLVPFPDAKSTLKRLQPEYNLRVVTGGTNGESKLDRLGLANYVDTVIVAPARGWSKRESEPFEAVLAELNTTPEETAVVGDRPTVDFAQPNRMGLLTVRVRRGQYATTAASGGTEPDVVVDSLSAIPEILDRKRVDG